MSWKRLQLLDPASHLLVLDQLPFFLHQGHQGDCIRSRAPAIGDGTHDDCLGWLRSVALNGDHRNAPTPVRWRVCGPLQSGNPTTFFTTNRSLTGSGTVRDSVRGPVQVGFSPAVNGNATYVAYVQNPTVQRDRFEMRFGSCRTAPEGATAGGPSSSDRNLENSGTPNHSVLGGLALLSSFRRSRTARESPETRAKKRFGGAGRRRELRALGGTQADAFFKISRSRAATICSSPF